MDVLDLNILTVGDIIKVSKQLYLWYGNNHIADTNGKLRVRPHFELVTASTYQERLDYFNKLYDNGLLWDDTTESFEAKDETKTKYHHGDILFDECGNAETVDGVCVDDGELRYTFYKKGIDGMFCYDFVSVKYMEYHYCSKTEMETIPKRKYRIVKLSDKNDAYADCFYIQERKLGFIWFYLCNMSMRYSNFTERYSLCKYFAMRFSSMEESLKNVLRLLFQECKESPIVKTKPDYKKEIFNINGIKFK